jgi:hypothetical protein
MDEARATRLKTLLGQKIDWTYLLQVANRQGVLPLLYWNLSDRASDGVPEAILAQLRGFFQNNTLHNLLLTRELLALLQLFQDRGIPAIPYKGPVLAAFVYSNLSLRQFCDLDILVRERDFLKSQELLIGEGYRSRSELEWEHSFVRESSGTCVDLHQRMTQRYFPFRFDFEGFWQRLESISLAGTRVANFSPEDLLLVLSVGLGKDCWCKQERLAKICDIAELVRGHQELDWERVVDWANQSGSRRMLFLGLYLARDLLGANLPEVIWQQMQADSVGKMLSLQVRDRLFEDTEAVSKHPLCQLYPRVAGAMFVLRMREHWRDKLRYAVHLLQVAIGAIRQAVRN